MKFCRLLLLCTFLFAFSLYAAEDIAVDYTYAGNHGVDLSKMRNSLEIGEFSDGRGIDNTRLITPEYQAEEALTAIIRDALIQGFENANAQLAETDADMSLVGNLLSSELQMVDRSGIVDSSAIGRTSLIIYTERKSLKRPANAGLF